MVELRRVDGGGRGRRWWREEDGGAVVVGAGTVAAGDGGGGCHGDGRCRETRVRVLGDEDDDVAESDWLIW